MVLSTVAVAGGTGNLGSKIVRELLTQRHWFQDVIVLARAASKSTDAFESQGAQVRLYSEEKLESSLEGVDVLINTYDNREETTHQHDELTQASHRVGPAGHHFKNLLVGALFKSSVRLYFPSEFGVDHYKHDFPHEEWDAKKHHFKLLNKPATGIHVCRVYAGLFLEDSIGPWFGFHGKKSWYEAVGSKEQATSYTSMRDVGRALAVLATLPPSEIPEQIHFSGDSKSVAEIAEVMEQAREDGKPIEVTEIALQPYKADVFANPLPTPEKYLRFLMAEGLIDHTDAGLGNDNALVEKDPDFGKWQSMADLAADTKGRPWDDYE